MNDSADKMTLKEVLLRFKGFYKDYYLHFALGVLGMLMASAGTAATAWLIEPVLNKIFIEKDIKMLYLLPFFIILIYLIKNLGLYLQVYYLAFIGIDMIKRLRIMVLDHIIYLDLKFFHKHKSGELISRCVNDIGSVRQILTSFVPEFLRESITAVALISVVFYQSLSLAFFAFIILPLAFYPVSVFAKKLRKLGLIFQEQSASMLSVLSEIFTNMELIKSFTAEKTEREKFNKEADKIAKISVRGMRIDALISPMMESFGSIGVAAVIIVGGREVIEGSLSVGSFFSFLTALFLAYGPVRKLSRIYAQLQNSLAASSRTFYLIDQIREIKEGSEELAEDINKIEFKNLHLSYENVSAINDLNLEIKKGEIIALVGRSGGGKSSLINLLNRFFEPQKGEIRINDKDIKDFTLKSLRANIALVSQNVYIFAASVAQNVAYGSEINEEKIKEALLKANALTFVEKLENGIHTELREHASNLSGGERQRIAIARALYKNSQILLFDEATSALDNESERVIIENLKELAKDKIVILIAHRLSSIKIANKIAVFDRGNLLDFADEQTLLSRCNFYKILKQSIEE